MDSIFGNWLTRACMALVISLGVADRSAQGGRSLVERLKGYRDHRCEYKQEAGTLALAAGGQARSVIVSREGAPLRRSNRRGASLQLREIAGLRIAKDWIGLTAAAIDTDPPIAYCRHNRLSRCQNGE